MQTYSAEFHKKSQRTMILGIVSLALCAGLSLGVISGMSSAPVAGALVSAVLSSVPALILLFTPTVGKKNLVPAMRRFLRSLTSFAMAIFFVSLVIGVFVGIYARQNNFFHPPPYVVEINDLTKAGFTGKKARSLFANRYAEAKSVDGPSGTSVQFDSGQLVGTELCEKSPSELGLNEPKRVVDFLSSESEELEGILTKQNLDTALDRLKEKNIFSEADRSTSILIFLEGFWFAVCKNAG